MSKIEEIPLNEFQVNPLYSLVSRGLIAKELKKLNNYDLSILLEMIEWELEDRKFYEQLNTEEWMFVINNSGPLSPYHMVVWGHTLDDNSFDLFLSIGDFSNSL